ADPAGRSFGRSVALAEGVELLTGVRVRIGSAATTVRYSVTRHRVTLEAHLAAGLTEPLEPGPGLVRATWERLEALAGYPFGSAQSRLIAWLETQGNAAFSQRPRP